MAAKILIADDSVTIQKVLRMTLEPQGYELVTVGDGDAALEQAQKVAPDLIISDVFMPQQDGYTVCSRIRQHARLAQTPVLLLAGTFEPFEEQRAREAGASDWLNKPFGSQELLDKVSALLAAAPAQQTASEAPAAVNESQEAATPEEPAAASVPEESGDEDDSWVDLDTLDLEDDLEEAPSAAAGTSALQAEPGVAEETEAPAAPEAAEGFADKEKEPVDVEPQPVPVTAQEDASDLALGDEALAEPAAFEPEAAKDSHKVLFLTAEDVLAYGTAPGDRSQLDEEALRQRVEAVARPMIEKVVWEVVPDLAEAMIQEELQKIKQKVPHS